MRSRAFILWIILLMGLHAVLSGCSFTHSVQQVAAPAHIAAADYSDSTITVAAGTHYKRSRLHTLFYGKHYRPAWYTPVQVHVLDIGTAKGGLHPMRAGGSRQTINLRLQNPQGTEYVLRSIDKEPASVLPEWLQHSYLADIARDANSALHPYAALVIPGLAAAAHIYHTTPELVYVPHDPRLGKYLPSIGGTLALLERRPDGDQTDNPEMGRAKEVKSTRSAMEERFADNDSDFDARFYLRARLLDMLLGDWSRHEDNWRWAERKHSDKGYTYQAIPRDRDNVFYRLNDAPVPWLFMHTGLKPHFQTYRPHLSREDLENLNHSGRNLDELILARLSWQDWQEVADSVQQELTDAVIEKAFHRMPDTIYQLTAAPLMAAFKTRRDNLPKLARTYYSILAEQVQAVGTDKHELFEVEVLSEKEVQLRVFKTDKDGEKQKLLWQRTFLADETDELELYGLSGDDHFLVTGAVKPKIKIKLWGGAGEDTYQVHSKGANFGNAIRIDDTKYRNTYDVDKHISIAVDDAIAADKYDAAGWLLRYYLN
ncbi:hypothetical protein [Pontibacter chitinilyticus]|uniref:hypothetical protein n=1 Tax=Pontibacter chitinilyticus TaxID=2674989 RepID=UPI00321B16BF